MSKLSRRQFIKLGSTSAAVAAGLSLSPFTIAGATKKVVIVGGGIGGATAAKYIRLADASIDVTIIEPNKHYYTCFMSNEVLGGERDLNTLKFGYDGLANHGVRVVHDVVTDIDANGRTVTTAGGTKLSYDRCIVAPGVDFKWDAIDGYDKSVAEKIPHAWKAGPQTDTLHKQLMAMKDGGTVVIGAPPNPFRCPPGPYERASQIAHYLKQHKPKSKVLILDPKAKFSKQGLFTAGWKRHYGYGTDNSMIEWIGGDKGGKIESLDAANLSVNTELDSVKADVLNIIPPQKAGKIAFVAGLTNDSGWCPVNGRTFESTIHSGIHVIGDASISSPLPKSGYAANSEAKVCAAAVIALLKGMDSPQPSYVNTCYSIVAPGDAMSVAMVYAYDDAAGKIIKVPGSGGLTPSDASAEMRMREEQYAHSWFKNITADVFG